MYYEFNVKCKANFANVFQQKMFFQQNIFGAIMLIRNMDSLLKKHFKAPRTCSVFTGNIWRKLYVASHYRKISSVGSGALSLIRLPQANNTISEC